MADAPFLAALDAAAREAEMMERDYRSASEKHLAALERKRVFAFRRKHLMAALGQAMAGAADEAAAFARGEDVLCEETSLAPDNEAHAAVIARFRPVIEAVDEKLNVEEDDQTLDPLKALADFENWYESEKGQPFLALFDVYRPETPRVDF